MRFQKLKGKYSVIQKHKKSSQVQCRTLFSVSRFPYSTKSTASYHVVGWVENWAVPYKLENIWTPLPNQPKLASK